MWCFFHVFFFVPPKKPPQLYVEQTNLGLQILVVYQSTCVMTRR
jgi:hypothetical protein